MEEWREWTTKSGEKRSGNGWDQRHSSMEDLRPVRLLGGLVLVTARQAVCIARARTNLIEMLEDKRPFAHLINLYRRSLTHMITHSGRQVRGTQDDQRHISHSRVNVNPDPSWFDDPLAPYTRWFPDSTDKADVEARAAFGSTELLLELLYEHHNKQQAEQRERTRQLQLKARNVLFHAPAPENGDTATSSASPDCNPMDIEPLQQEPMQIDAPEEHVSQASSVDSSSEGGMASECDTASFCVQTETVSITIRRWKEYGFYETGAWIHSDGGYFFVELEPPATKRTGIMLG